eukprot:m.159392 g.159392  ORF g.159392 m.159392 type:complete len:754 (+) comp17037_c0_seq2:284-2545(+)
MPLKMDVNGAGPSAGLGPLSPKPSTSLQQQQQKEKDGQAPLPPMHAFQLSKIHRRSTHTLLSVAAEATVVLPDGRTLGLLDKQALKNFLDSSDADMLRKVVLIMRDRIVQDAKDTMLKTKQMQQENEQVKAQLAGLASGHSSPSDSKSVQAVPASPVPTLEQDEMATLRQQTENLAASNADLTEQINLLKKQLAILCADQPLAEEIIKLTESERKLEAYASELKQELDAHVPSTPSNRSDVVTSSMALEEDQEALQDILQGRRISEMELLTRLQEKDRMLSETDETLVAYMQALRNQDDLLQKSARLLAAERRKVSDLQTAFNEQTERLRESETLLNSMAARGAEFPHEQSMASLSAVGHEDETIRPVDMVMIRCAVCSQMISVEKLDSHTNECKQAQIKNDESKQMLQVMLTDPEVARSTGLLMFKVVTRTNIPEYAGRSFQVRRSVADFVWLSNAMRSLFPTRIVPPMPTLQLKPEDLASEARLAANTANLQRFIARLTNHQELRRQRPLRVFLTALSKDLDAIKAEILPTESVFEESDPSFETDIVIGRTMRNLVATQEAFSALASRFEYKSAMALQAARDYRKDHEVFTVLARSGTSESYINQSGSVVASMFSSLANVLAGEHDVFQGLKHSTESIVDYSASACALVHKLDLTIREVDFYRRKLESNDFIHNQDAESIEEHFSAASSRLDLLSDHVWEELQTFELRKDAEMRDMVVEMVAFLAEHCQQLFCKWSSIMACVSKPVTRKRA